MTYNYKCVADVIDEIAMGPFGSNIKVDCFVKSGIPVLNGSNLNGYTLTEDSFHYVTPQKAASLNKAVASRGDVIITHRGTLGQIVYIPNDSKYTQYVISQSQFRVRCKKNVILPEFFVYYFHSREGQSRLLSNTSQVGVPSLARPSSTFKKLEIPVPSISKQEAIVDVLTALDARIAENKKINHHLPSPISATDSSPDIRRGKRVSRSSARRAFSLQLLSIVSKIGCILSSNAFISFVAGAGTNSVSKSRVTMASKTAPFALRFNFSTTVSAR